MNCAHSSAIATALATAQTNSTAALWWRMSKRPLELIG
jgi:hypothetical protein